MKSPFFDYVEEITPFVVAGSTAIVKQGYALTKQTYKGHHHASWVGRDTTFVLGCNPEGRAAAASAAEWTLAVDASLAARSHDALLVICCDRAQGGLHSPNKGDLARVLVNEQVIDIIGLKDVPRGHDDYFHRVTHQEIPSVPVVKNAGTVYSFNVPVSFLTKSKKEKVSVSLDPGTAWDIDHVIVVLKHMGKRIRPWVVGLIFTILGALGGVAASEVWKYFVESLK